jgi:hypothetical protein
MNKFSGVIQYMQQEAVYSTLTTAAEITDMYSPYAQGCNIDGLVIPNPELLVGNPYVNAWCDRMLFYNTKQINYWLKETNSYKGLDMVNFITLLDMECMQYLLPFVTYTPNPRNIQVRFGTLMDLIVEYNMTTVSELRSYLFVLCALGIFLNDYMAEEVFEIQNEGEFIASRLFQGEIDYQMTKKSLIGRPAGMYVSGGGEEYSSLPFYKTINGPITTEEFSDLVAREKIKLQNVRFVGNEAPQVVAMKDALQLSGTYSDYLSKRDDRFAKVGGRQFMDIVLGSAKRKEITFKDPSGREITRVYGNPQPAAPNPRKWPTAYRALPFESMYNTPIVNMSAPGGMVGAVNNRGAANGEVADPNFRIA